MIATDIRVSDIRTMFRNITPDPTTGMLELVNANFIADEPSIFGTVNEDWNKRELQWYLSQSLDVRDIPEPIPKTWKDVASTKHKINSNYGWCVFSRENGFQFDNALSALQKDKHSRQACLIYNRPSMHEDSKVDSMKDFMCTFSQQFLIRNDKLHFLSYMRSNDAIFGYKGDYAWATYLHNEALDVLQCSYKDLQKGDLIWNCASLHIYPRHHHLVE